MATINKKDINYALVEEKRPPLYTCMKYWGKKPHNIWKTYINHYTGDGFYLDPFSGSAMSAFECVKAGKKSIAFDINPLTSFIIEVVCSEYDRKAFTNVANEIINNVSKNSDYLKLYKYKNDYDDFIVHNVKWNNNEIYEVCVESIDGKQRECLEPVKEDYLAVKFSDKINIEGRYPKKAFRTTDSFTNSFLTNIGNTYDKLWSKRNLVILSLLFNEIINIKDETLAKQLLFAFVQTVHLCSKMCVPRSKSTKRDFSTSWGRSAFMYTKKQMEMNPLLLFKKNCFEKQSVDRCLSFANKYFGRKIIVQDINLKKFDPSSKVDIWYGIVDAKNIDKLLPEKSVDFILTDPPYGGLIQYLDLSSIWLSWLELYDLKYCPNYEEEITVNCNSTYEDFEDHFTQALKSLNYVLSDEAKIVLTFHNKDLKTWQSFLKSLENGGFKIEKVIYQQNKRTGESNVSDPYGTSASDFYIRCVKNKSKYLQELSKDDLENIIVSQAKEIIRERAEPTPFQILFNGVLAKLSMAGFDIKNFDLTFQSCLKKHIPNDFEVKENLLTKAGNYWWVSDMKFDILSQNTLSNRVERFIDGVLKKKNHVSNDNILSLLYKEFPNGQTPDIKSIIAILEKLAYKKNEIWYRR